MNPLKLIIGIGNRARGDDAAGLEVARRLMTHPLHGWEIRATDGEPTKLMEMWSGRESVIAVDAVVTGIAPVGTVHQWDASETPLPTCGNISSSHALGLSEAIELARVLNQLPPKVRVIGIEGTSYEMSENISPAVEKAIGDVVNKLWLEIGDQNA